MLPDLAAGKGVKTNVMFTQDRPIRGVKELSKTLQLGMSAHSCSHVETFRR